MRLLFSRRPDGWWLDHGGGRCLQRVTDRTRGPDQGTRAAVRPAVRQKNQEGLMQRLLGPYAPEGCFGRD